MATALRHENSSASDYAAGLPSQLLSVGLLVTPLAIAGFVRLWRTPELRFIAVAATLMVVYVLAWIPGNGYYTGGLAPAVLAAGCAAAERWIARGPGFAAGAVGRNAYWMWGPGGASDSTVLVVDALGQLRPYFASCRLLTTYQAPYHVQNDWTGLQIGVCTGPVAGWPELWPRLKHYG